MTMMIYALFVGMVEICCFVMDAQEHFIKVRYTLQNIWWRKLTLFCDLCLLYPLPAKIKIEKDKEKWLFIYFIFCKSFFSFSGKFKHLINVF
jgi:hypothetical protein